MTTTEQTHKATVSNFIPDTDFHYRTFYYSPGIGFDKGTLVYVGMNEWRTKEEAERAAARWLHLRA